jgi:hypothetical protein
MNSPAILPTAFVDLEPHVGWALPTETERNAHRMASSQAELEAFANALVPRLDDIAAYLNQFPLDAMPADARALFYILLSVAEVAPAVESYRRPVVPFGFSGQRFKAQENDPRRPRP